MQGSTPIFVRGPDLFWTTTSGALQFHQTLLFVVYFGIQSRAVLYSFVGSIQPLSHRLKSQHFFKNISFKRTWRYLKVKPHPLTPRTPPPFALRPQYSESVFDFLGLTLLGRPMREEWAAPHSSALHLLMNTDVMFLTAVMDILTAAIAAAIADEFPMWLLGVVNKKKNPLQSRRLTSFFEFSSLFCFRSDCVHLFMFVLAT